VKELFKGTAVNHEVEIKEGSDVVGKFIDGFRLLRHQIQAREWMKERETGNSRGGILADDMGSVIFPIFVFWGVELCTA
jgi:SNF2 family DNA or RNA helicase